jgi:hypothetical protein
VRVGVDRLSAFWALALLPSSAECSASGCKQLLPGWRRRGPPVSRLVQPQPLCSYVVCARRNASKCEPKYTRIRPIQARLNLFCPPLKE